MDGKELRKFSRKDLLEIILEQTKKIEELEFELDRANKKLNERKASLKNIGSLAEASLVLSDIFKTADETAKIYIENIKYMAEQEEKNIKKELRTLKKKKLEAIDKECEARILNAEKEIENKKKEKNIKVKDASKKNKTSNTKKNSSKKAKRKK